MEQLSFPLIMLVVVLYFVPSLVATLRRASHSGAIFLLNFILGFTLLILPPVIVLIAWIAALIWAAADSRQQRPKVRPVANWSKPFYQH